MSQMPLLPFQHSLSRTFPSAGSPGCVKLSLTCLLPDLCNSLPVSAGRPRQVGLGSTEQWVHRASYVWTKYRPFLFAFLYWVLCQHWTVLLAAKVGLQVQLASGLLAPGVKVEQAPCVSVFCSCQGTR